MTDIQPGADVFFLLMGAILVFAMHGGFAFLEVGTVRHKNQVNALVKIIADFAISTVVYFFIGYGIAYGIGLPEDQPMSLSDHRDGATPDPPTGRRASPWYTSSSSAPSRPPSPPSSRAASPSGRNSGRSAWPRPCWSASPIRCWRAWSGTATTAGRPASLRRCWARRSTISPVPSSCTRSAAGSRSRPCDGSGRASGATGGTGARWAFRRRRCRGWPWARGCCALDGSGSTSCRRNR